jgi:serine/threonine protein kinase/ABC-type nitrate/sulfonate/bicarbonate transport system substrate-binding protein
MRIASAACPSLETLEHYLHDHLAPDEASRIDVHIDACSSCQGRLDEMIGELPDYLPGAGPEASQSRSREAEETPPELPRFEVIARLASGGMGVVWRVQDLEFQRTLAIKVMKRQASRRADHVQRFFQEARLCAQLAHPSIVPIHAMGRLDDGRPYYTMKLVEGETLAARLRRRHNPPDGRLALLKIFHRLCQAVAFAHRQGIIHRDLKPHNVMLGQHGEVQLMDWGLAKIIRDGQQPRQATHPRGGEAHGDDSPDHASASPGSDFPPTTGSTNRSGRRAVSSDTRHAAEPFATQAGAVLGTLAYMPPEQARGEVDAVDRRSDVFALGSILCEILTGAPAYAGADFWSMRLAASEARLDDARARLQACDADAELVELAEQLLAPNKLDRPASAEVVSDALAVYLKREEERSLRAEAQRVFEARRFDTARRAWQRCRQRPLGSSIAVALAGFVLWMSIVLLQPSPKLRIGIKPWVGFSPLAVADDLGLCQGVDLVLEPVEDHEDALQKLARGEIDAVLCPLEGQAIDRAAGHRTKAVLKLDDSLTADAIVARGSIHSPADVRGQQVVFVQMDVPHYLLLAFLERHGLDASSVKLVAAATAEEAVQQFIENEQIAAVAIYEPYLQQALGSVPGAHLLTTAEQEGGAVIDLLTIDEAYLSAHRRQVQSLAKGWFAAIERLRARDPQALASACRFLSGTNRPPLSVAQYDAMTAGMRYCDQQDNERFFKLGPDGSSEFRSRLLAAHARLSQWYLLRDTARPDASNADGAAVLSNVLTRK